MVIGRDILGCGVWDLGFLDMENGFGVWRRAGIKIWTLRDEHG
jgi:hypothetical protein